MTFTPPLRTSRATTAPETPLPVPMSPAGAMVSASSRSAVYWAWALSSRYTSEPLSGAVSLTTLTMLPMASVMTRREPWSPESRPS